MGDKAATPLETLLCQKMDEVKNTVSNSLDEVKKFALSRTVEEQEELLAIFLVIGNEVKTQFKEMTDLMLNVKELIKAEKENTIKNPNTPGGTK